MNYTYTDAGRLKTRTWERGVVTTYGYDQDTGELTDIDYSDSTPSVDYGYNRLGRRDSVTDGSGYRTLDYTSLGQIELEEYKSSSSTDDILLGRAVKHVYDGDTGRLEEINVLDGQTILHSQQYGYHSTNNRLDEVSEGPYEARYRYEAQRYNNRYIDLYKGTSSLKSRQQVLDSLNRVNSVWAGAPYEADFLHLDYDYDDTNRRIVEWWSGWGSYEPTWGWEYGYDSLGQVTSAQLYWTGGPSDPSDPVQGQQYAYVFDDIGNRTQTTTNGETATYTLATGSSSGLNQYADRDVPDVIDVLGFSLYDDSQSDLEINGVTAQHRRDEYFYHQLENLGNSTSDLYEEVEVVESIGGTPVAEESGYYFVAEDPEEFTYDEDGNLLSDGRWDYFWDGENRLIRMEETREDLHTSEYRRKLTFTYDDQGRKVRTEEAIWVGYGFWYNLGGSTWQRHYVYSGWNVIGEGYADPSGTGNWDIDKTYLWGLDQAERTDYRATNGWSSIGKAAGGVGGLLLVTDHDANEAHFAHSDANGNVVALIDADGNGEFSAIYDYDPFGNLIRVTGPAAELNPFRFSTKYHHEYFGLYYYGFRFYSPGQGRFLNRDPMEEEGGLNLYAFVGNDPVNNWDYLGLINFKFEGCTDKQEAAMDVLGERIQGAISEADSVVSDDYLSNARTRRILENWFSISTTQGLGRGPFGLETVRETLGRINSAADSEEVTITCCGDCKVGEWGYVERNRWTGNVKGPIHICLETFESGEERLANTIIHEMVHKYADVRGDLGFWNKSIGSAAGPSGGAYEDPNNRGSDIRLTRDQLVDNPDTYSWMIMNEFFE